MFCMAAQSLGYRSPCSIPVDDSPAGAVADGTSAPTIWTRSGLRRAGRAGDAAARPNSRTCRRPRWSSWRALRACRPARQRGDRPGPDRREALSRRSGVEVAPHAVIASADDARPDRASLLPGILKTARLGYDGKGQARVARRARSRAALARWAPCPACSSRRLPLEFELRSSLRARDGAMVTFPVARTAPRRHPRRVDRPCAHRQRSAQTRAAGRGRHRDGAATTSACCASSSSSSTGGCRQRDGAAAAQQRALQHRRLRRRRSSTSRCACSPACRSATRACMAPAVMLNLLGDLWFADGGEPARARVGTPCWRARRRSCTCTARAEARRGRKMGHLTCIAADAAGGARSALARWPACSASAAGLSWHEPRPRRLATRSSRAARRPAAGGLVAIPTETVYGLGGRRRQCRCGARDFRRQGPAGRPSADRARGRRRHDRRLGRARCRRPRANSTRRSGPGR